MNDRRPDTRPDVARFFIHHLPWLTSVLVFLSLGAYQLQLPGLHYDEAKEAGLNAMQLVTGQPVTAFRDAVVQLGPWRLPLMVQDYIGALNPLLAVPCLALAGLDPARPERGVVALRCLPLLIGAATLVLAWMVASRLSGPLAASVTAALLAVNPAFIFWSRQGVFVTNLTALLFMATLLVGVRWWQERRPCQFWLMAFFCGPWDLCQAVVRLGDRGDGRGSRPRCGSCSAGSAAPIAHVRVFGRAAHRRRPGSVYARSGGGCRLFPGAPASPGAVQPADRRHPGFHLRQSGALLLWGKQRSLFCQPGSRAGEIGALLRGDFFWYLGEVFANPWASWIAAGLALAGLALSFAGLIRARNGIDRLPVGRDGGSGVTADPGAVASLKLLSPALPVVLLALIVLQSAFTVSDLFITHYILLLPLIPLSAGLAVGALATWQSRAGHSWRKVAFALGVVVPLLAVALWWGGDLWTTVRYHRVLSIAGGYGGHSDAINELAAYLVPGSPSAPVALDWGLDAPLRFLTVGRVNPVEVFGYATLDRPDDGFAGRIGDFLDNPNNIYLAHAPDSTVFQGRVEALESLATQRGLELKEERRFRERNGRTLFIAYRVVPR